MSNHPTKQTPDARRTYECKDCGRDVLQTGDWYMASPELWEGLKLGWEDNLCITCLDNRLGREAEFPGDICPVLGTLNRVAPRELSATLRERFAGRRPRRKARR
jgi:hypothetical protein